MASLNYYIVVLIKNVDVMVDNADVYPTSGTIVRSIPSGYVVRAQTDIEDI